MILTISVCIFAVSAAATDEPPYETRALWASEVDIDSPQDIDRLIALMESANLNMLLPCVFCHGNVYFKNRFLDMNPGLPSDFDPLAYVLKKAHAAGIEVHPWFCVTYIGVRGVEGGGMLLRKYPEFGALARGGADWAAPDSGGGLYANVHSEPYRNFIVALMTEMVRDYEVDGLHYDYIRAAADSQDDETVKEFHKRFGHDMSEAAYEEWVAWNSPAIDDIVRRATEGARTYRPSTIISGAVFTNIPHVRKQGQDAVKWAAQDWLDVIFTMDYEMSTQLIRLNEMNFAGLVGKSSHGVGLSLYQFNKEGKVESRPAALVLEQIKAVRRLGINQFAFFASVYLDDAISDALAGGLFKQKAIPYHRGDKR
ncbi:MAG: family 10 glycosylhydrolase [bacterium]